MLNRRALQHLIHRRVDQRPLAVARIIIAVAALSRAGEAARILGRVFEPGKLRLPYISWVPALTEAGIPWLLAAWAGAALALLLGWRTRLAGMSLAIVMGYYLLVDQQTYSNHLYLLCLLSLLLAWADAGAAYSLDAMRSGPRLVANGPITLLRAQLSIVYGFSAITKLNLSYLSGTVLSLSLAREGWHAIPGELRTPKIMFWVALATILAEAFLALGIWIERWRPTVFVVGLALH